MVEGEQTNVIEQANQAAERLEKANKEQAELLKKMEALESRKILSGQASAGSAQVVELSAEDKLKQGLRNYWKGSALEGVFK
jgi:hypothetical protein